MDKPNGPSLVGYDHHYEEGSDQLWGPHQFEGPDNIPHYGPQTRGPGIDYRPLVKKKLEQSFDLFESKKRGAKDRIPSVLYDLFRDPSNRGIIIDEISDYLKIINNEKFRQFVISFMRKNNYMGSIASSSYPNTYLLLNSLENMHTRLAVLEQKLS